MEDFKFKVFTGDQDREIAEKVRDEIMPLLKGLTINQVEIALKSCLEVAKASMIIMCVNESDCIKQKELVISEKGVVEVLEV